MIHCDKIEAKLAELFNTRLSNDIIDVACLCEVSKQTKWLLCANFAQKNLKNMIDCHVTHCITIHPSLVTPLAVDPSIPRGVTLLLNGPLWWWWKLLRRLCIVDWVTRWGLQVLPSGILRCAYCLYPGDRFFAHGANNSASVGGLLPGFDKVCNGPRAEISHSV